MVYVEGLRRLCFDTDFLVNYMRKPSGVVKLIMKRVYEGRVLGCTTSVNTFEIWFGVYLAPRPEDLVEDTEELLSQLEIIGFDYEASIGAGSVMAELKRMGQVIDIRDLFVGTICKVNGAPLVTRNVKHYDRISGLTVLKPEEAVRKTR